MTMMLSNIKTFEEERINFIKTIEKQIKRAEHDQEKALNYLNLCKEWEVFSHEGILLQNHIHFLKRGMTSFTVEDWLTPEIPKTLQLNPKNTPQIEIQKRFDRSKALKAKLPGAEKRLQEIENKLKLCKIRLEKATLAETVEQLEEIKQEMQPKHATYIKPLPPPKPISLPYRVFVSKTGMTIWVGKNAKDNDQLSLHLSQKEDWWLHAHRVAGSHVVIRIEEKKEPDEETLKDAMQLALHYSKAKGEGEVSITQCKYVSKSRNSPAGQVLLSKHSSRSARLDPERLKRLLDSQEQRK